MLKVSLLLLGMSLSVIVPTQVSTAQTAAVPQPSQVPPDGDNPYAVTSNTISQQGITVPSLWWAQEQFGGELLNNWLAYPANGSTPGRIDLLIDRQKWSLLDYLERYEFINHFGNVARDYGYNVRVFNSQQELLATYTCNFNTTPSLCNIQVEATGKAKVRGSS